MKLFGHRRDLQCQHAVELITDYLDDALPREQRRRLENHLAACPHCAAYLAQIRATIAALGRVTAEDLDPRSRAGLLQLYRDTRP